MVDWLRDKILGTHPWMEPSYEALADMKEQKEWAREEGVRLMKAWGDYYARRTDVRPEKRVFPYCDPDYHL